MLIRHSEKPDAAKGILGVTRDGREDRRELSVRGWQRAGALPSLFVRELPAPDKIYACRPDQKSARSLRTVESLAVTLSIETDIRFGNDEETALVADALQAEGTVLISWKHEGLPRIAKQLLGGANTAPSKWPSDRFDMTWVLDRDPDGVAWIFGQIPQLLLPGDRADPIPKI